MFTFRGTAGELLLYQRILLRFADRDSRWVLSPRLFSKIFQLSLVLQNRFADIEPLSDPQNEALFEILNPEDVIFNTDVDWP